MTKTGSSKTSKRDSSNNGGIIVALIAVIAAIVAVGYFGFVKTGQETPAQTSVTTPPRPQ